MTRRRFLLGLCLGSFFTAGCGGGPAKDPPGPPKVKAAPPATKAKLKPKTD